MRIGQRAQQYAFDDGEDSCICADTERQGQNREERRSRRLPKLAQGAGYIVQQSLQGSLQAQTIACLKWSTLVTKCGARNCSVLKVLYC